MSSTPEVRKRRRENALKAELVLQIKQFRRLAVTGVLEEGTGEKFGIPDKNVLVVSNVEVDQKVDFISHVRPRGSRWIDPDWNSCCVKKWRVLAVESEVVILRQEGDPVGGICDELSVKIVNVLATDKIEVAHVVVAEGKELVESIETVPRSGISIPGRIVISEPDLRLPAAVRKMVSDPVTTGTGEQVLIGIISELEHLLEVPEDVVVIPGIAGADCGDVRGPKNPPVPGHQRQLAVEI